MQLEELLDPERVACSVHSASKKRALEELSHLIVQGDPSLGQTEIFECLVARERLGSTGLGKGVAIPHGRLKSGNKAIAAFLQLDQGVDFDAPDGQPVDLMCALLVPPESTEEHLEILAKLSEMFREPAIREELRTAQKTEDVYKILDRFFSKH